MCDNFVVLPKYTSQARMIIAKNSDRPAYESQPLVYNYRQTHQEGEMLTLAYVSIPQVKETALSMGSSPYWCWGYEQGINEYGVVIGNEAIFTKDLKQNVKKEKGIIGMELVRLGLERGKSAKEALSVITNLIETYGQWGSAAVGEENYYNNSYIIADSKEAWVLETVDRQWIAKRIKDNFYAISNEMSIRNEWDLISDHFIDEAIQLGWWSGSREQFDATYAYTDFTKPLQVSHIRVQRTNQLLREQLNKNKVIDVNWAKRILRDHYEDTFLEGPFFNEALPDFLTICMHSSPANFTWGITAASTIFELPQDKWHFPLIWWAPTTPCTGLYLPLFMCEQELPEIFSNAGTVREKTLDPTKAQKDETAKDSLWWNFRDLLDEIKGDENGILFKENKRIARKHFDRLEQKWLTQVREIEKEAADFNKNGKCEEAIVLVTAFSKSCLNEAIHTISEIRTQLYK